MRTAHGGIMSKRFSNYQPSTALRQAIEALNRAKKDRAAMKAGGGQSPMASGPVLPIHIPPGSDAGSVTGHATTPGRESANAKPAQGQRGPIGERPKGNGALTSGRDLLGENDDA